MSLPRVSQSVAVWIAIITATVLALVAIIMLFVLFGTPASPGLGGARSHPSVSSHKEETRAERLHAIQGNGEMFESHLR